ncbi:MAG: hypothetical protein H0W58_17025 [Acidobacteria bacterium]|jgi:hypothetical protein|nr:hypothetical protein [Acidobacteriota bacterium]
MIKVKSKKVNVKMRKNADFRFRLNVVKKSKLQLYLPFYLLLFTFYLCLSISTFAQADEPEDTTAPPPLKFIPKEEKSQLKTETDIKKHTILALEMMDARVVKAENFNTQKQYREMFGELGGFHALLDDTLDYLNKHDNDSSKVLNNFKRLELSLRKFAPRLELIRRELPIKYELYVRNLIKYVRQARSKAVEPFFDNSVVPESGREKPQ